MTTVGLGMTAYNRDRFLAEAIDSVLAQTYTDWRLVIVDDGSTDATLAIAQSYAAKDPRITVISQSNHGCGHALNRAIAALGVVEYIGWVDSDDRLHPEALAKTVGYLGRNPATDMVYTHYHNLVEGEDRGLGQRCRIPYSRERLVVEFMVFHFRLIRADAYCQLGGIDPDLTAAIDYDFALRFSECFVIACLPEVLYYYRQHDDRISHIHRSNQVEQAAQAVQRAIARRSFQRREVA